MINEESQDKSVPLEFHQNNNSKSQRSIKLAEQAKKWLIENNIVVTEITFLDATRKVDEEGKGVSHSTLFKNDTVRKVYQSINPKFLNSQKKNKKKKPSKSKRSFDSNLRELYRDNSKLAVIKALETIKEENRNLENKNRVLLLERDELKRQNTNQLVLLTHMQETKKKIDEI